MDPEDFGGRYFREALLGVGGMARVYLARDRTLGRPVAVKVLSTDLHPDPRFVERFRREAQAAAGINHPNVVRIYDWGEQDHTYYMVMEYVPGSTLKEMITQRGPLPESEALRIAVQVVSALQAAHEHGLIHRDVKPQNVLLDPNGWVKMTDFGIVRAIGLSQLTRTDMVCGTPQYISPEQAQRGETDARSDVYSLGVVLYEMVTGWLPFTGASAVSVALQHVRDAPVPPRDLNPSLSPAIERIILRAMAKNPAERFTSAASMRAALEEAQDARIVRHSDPEPTIMVAPIHTDKRARPAPIAPASAAPRERRRGPIPTPAAPPPRTQRRGLFAVPFVLLGSAAAGALAIALLHVPHGSSLHAASGVAPSATPRASTITPRKKPVVAAVPSTRTPLPSPKATSTPTLAPTEAPARTAQTTATTPATSGPSRIPATSGPVLAAINSPSGSPVDAVTAYYQSVAAHRFTQAADLWSSNMYALGYTVSGGIVGRFAQTTGMDVLKAQLVQQDTPPGTAEVSVDVVEHRVSSSAREYHGYWYLVRGSAGWLLSAPQLTQVR